MALCATLFLLTSCSSNPFQNPKDLARSLSTQQNFKPIQLHTSKFTLQGFIQQRNSQNIHIYIEGDGLAWADLYEISDDPTPKDPLALRLAFEDNTSNTVLYLARPCQYLKTSSCDPYYWTFGRFDPVIIDAFNEALNQVKKALHASNFALLGYSGGGAVALLVAAHRHDVKEVVTFAGTLDPDRWASLHDYTPLQGSLKPTSFTDKLKHIPQTHYIGKDDDEMPPQVSQSYLKYFKDAQHIKIIEVPHVNHWEGWIDFWKIHLKKKGIN